jgi:flavodoxin
MSKGAIVYSSKTGNTRKLGLGIHEILSADFDVRIFSVEEAPDPAGYSWILLGFWVDRGTADKATLKYLERLEGCNVGFFGTLGAYPDSQHARDVKDRVGALIREKNNFLGSFLSQGKVDPKLIEMFKKLPPDNPHAMNEERRKRHAEAAKHPDQRDIVEGAEACRKMIATVGADK